MRPFFILSLFALVFLTWPARAEIIAIAAGGGQETITLSVPATAGRKIFTLPSPDRLVVDVPSIDSHPKAGLPRDYQGDLVKDVRFGQFNADTSRFVFDLAQPVTVKDVREEDGRIIIRIAAAGAPKAVSRTETRAEPPPARKSHKEAAAPKPKKPEKPLVMIDPGHGGIDPGTKAADGTYEKYVTLAYARALKARLLKTGKYRVKLTREDDRFIMLRQRVAMARQAGADLFISLHADSAPAAEVRGLSVYTLSEKASDDEAEALAARENKADVLAGVDLTDERNDVAGILISLAQRETTNHSAALADLILASLDERVQLLSNSHRFAGFAVLKAPDVPSVLVEVGFLSQPKEEKLLQSKAYREKVVSGIAAGVAAYFRQQGSDL